MVINSIDLQDNVSLRLAKLVEMKLIENYNKWWGDTVFLITLNVSAMEFLRQNLNLNTILFIFQMTQLQQCVTLEV